MNKKKDVFAFLNLRQNRYFAPAYEGQTDPPADPPKDPPADPPKDPPADPPKDPPADPADPAKKFTQAELDKIVQQRLAKSGKTTNDLAQKVEELSSNMQMTQEQRDQLEEQLEAARNQFKTDAQIAKETQEKAQRDHSEALGKEQEKTKRYQDLYETNLISQSIDRAMTEFDAFEGPALPSFLRGMTSVKETVDADGKPTGTFAPVVSYPDVDDGKPVVLELAIRDAIKRMSETPDTYGYLFKAHSSGGLGSSNAGGARLQNFDPAKVSPSEYQRLRKEGKLPHQQSRS